MEEKGIKKLEDYKLDAEYRAEMKRRLYNYVLTALQAHSITQEDFEDVVYMLEESYRKEAVIQSMEGIIKPLDSIN